MTAEALAPLSAEGWILLHDRRNPSGGNVDHVIVGPGGIVVLDSKAWTGPVAVVGGSLQCEGRDAHDAVTGMGEVVALLADGTRTEVRGALVFIGTEGVDTLPAKADGVGMVRIENLVARLRRITPRFSASEVDQLATAVANLLPPAGERVLAPRPAAVDERSLDRSAVLAVAEHPAEKRYRFYLARDWSRYGNQRLYLTAPDGTKLGWVDCNTGTTNNTTHADARALLDRLHEPTKAPADDVSVISPVGRIGTKVLGLLGNDRDGMGHVVGRVWQKGDLWRLYVTLHCHGQHTVDIGWVDLATGKLHPTDPVRTGLLEHTFHVLYGQLAG